MLDFICLARPVGSMSGRSLTSSDAISGAPKRAFA